MKRIPVFFIAVCLACASTAFAQTTTTITNFDSLTAGVQALFQDPTFSGSTDTYIASTPTPSSTVVDTEYYTAPNSEEVTFGWANQTSTNWCRLTTYNCTNVPNPIIDYSKAIVFKIKVTQGDFYLSFLTRDNGASGAIGTDGSGSGEIDEIIPPGGPIHFDAAVNSGWQQVVVSIPGSTIGPGITGDGVLSNSTGTLEAFRIGIGSSTAVTFYVDDVGEQDIPATVKDWQLF